MNYEINEDTLVISPYGKERSKVIEYSKDYIINDIPYKIMEDGCNYFGSSLSGRMEGSKNILGSMYKIPLIVEGSRGMIFFPTKSPNSVDNIWISLKDIVSYKKVDNKRTMLEFKNHKKVIVNVPYFSIDNQVLRSTRLQVIYNSRKNGKN